MERILSAAARHPDHHQGFSHTDWHPDEGGEMNLENLSQILCSHPGLTLHDSWNAQISTLESRLYILPTSDSF